MAEKDFHISAKYNFRHALRGILGYIARKRLDAQVLKDAFPGRQVFLDTP
jgi:hypothetical protein